MYKATAGGSFLTECPAAGGGEDCVQIGKDADDNKQNNICEFAELAKK